VAKSAQTQATAAEKFRTILVPLDFSPCSLAAYTMALSLARQYQAELLLLYVLDVRTLAAVERLGVRIPPDKLKMIRHRLRLSFRGLMESQKGVKMQRLIREGEPFSEIMRVSRMEKADLIVIGTYGGQTGEVEKIFFGSTAEKVVRAAPCPVLCVPLPKKAESEEFGTAAEAAHA
jgi:nucleotide-binding universal stress UspA family protein